MFPAHGIMRETADAELHGKEDRYEKNVCTHHLFSEGIRPITNQSQPSENSGGMYEVQFYDTVQSYPQFLTMIVVFFGALFLGNGTLDVPVLVTFLLYVGSLSEPITLLLNFMRLYEEGKAGFLRFSEMMDVQPEITQSSSPVTLPDGPKSVEFDDVSFRYDEAAEDVLRHVSFTVPAGQTAAFVGASGIGKTTVCSLIARFYDATDGSVCIGGTDVRELSFESLRRTVGIVQQEVCLFNGTIRDNIRYGSPDASDEEVERAASCADLHDFILSATGI